MKYTLSSYNPFENCAVKLYLASEGELLDCLYQSVKAAHCLVAAKVDCLVDNTG